MQHDPHLSWRTGEVLKWDKSCFPHCFPRLPRPLSTVPVQLPVHSTSVESPVEKQSVNIPSSYSHFSDVFCPKRAAQLPSHRPWDCAIDLFPGEPVPHGKIYPLSLPEQKAMKEYIEEALKQGCIIPSTSPAASSFFFVAKKDGGLRPCIDYRKLNEITVKFQYPLPLVPTALEQLRGATIFTKLDLRSAYNRICEGDEWKKAFVTPTGHYEYRGNAVRASQCSFSLPRLYARGAPGVSPSVRHRLHRRHPHILPELGQTSPTRCGGPPTFEGVPFIP